MTPIDYVRLAAIDRRDAEARDAARSQALIRAQIGRELTLPKLGEFTHDHLRALRVKE